METCFNKFESQTSFGSMYKTRIEGYQMFCDFYNPQTGELHPPGDCIRVFAVILYIYSFRMASV
jgi:hypothetical protein